MKGEQHPVGTERYDDAAGSGGTEGSAGFDASDRPTSFPGVPGGAGRVAEIPLFPLDLVLFPNMILPLHIFEERYKTMINQCVHESLPFGIVLATGVQPGTGQVETSPVGCTARIARVERLPDGCMNIEVIGEERFRILDTHEQQPYRTGLTEPYEDIPADDEEVEPLCREVMDVLHEFLTRSLAIMGKRIEKFELPYHPEQISFTAACVLPLTNEEKQGILSDRDVISRLESSREALQREVDRLRRAAAAAWKKVELASFDAYRCDN
jgi:Lon protease-like protein